MALDENIEGFVVHVTCLLILVIYPAKEAQIAYLITKEVKILVEYLDFSDVFQKKRFWCYWR